MCSLGLGNFGLKWPRLNKLGRDLLVEAIFARLCSFREFFFLHIFLILVYVNMGPPEQGHSRPREQKLNKLGRVHLHDAICHQSSRPRGFRRKEV